MVQNNREDRAAVLKVALMKQVINSSFSDTRLPK